MTIKRIQFLTPVNFGAKTLSTWAPTSDKEGAFSTAKVVQHPQLGAGVVLSDKDAPAGKQRTHVFVPSVVCVVSFEEPEAGGKAKP